MYCYKQEHCYFHRGQRNIGMEHVSHQRQVGIFRISHQHCSTSLGYTSPSPFLGQASVGPAGRQVGGAIIRRWSWGVLVSQYIKKRPEGCNNSRNQLISRSAVFQTRIVGGLAACTHSLLWLNFSRL